MPHSPVKAATRTAALQFFNPVAVSLPGKSGSAWKEQLKSDIDEAIKNAATYEDCIEPIRAIGYEIKGADFVEKAHKFISFRPLDRERFVRGSAKSLGTEYTKERIRERIEKKALAKDKERVPFPARKKPVVKDYSRKNLIDTTEDKFAESPGLMLMYGKETGNRKQEIDRQHHTIPNQRG